MPKISIIVPVYNMEKHLKTCVDSLLAQKADCEIILVDDGSKDNSPAICDDYAAKYDHVRVIHKQNDGLSMARNTGLDAAEGEYISFVDSDDWLDPDMMEKLLAAAEKYNVDMAVTGISCDFADTGAKVSNQPDKEAVYTGTEQCCRGACDLDAGELLAFATNKLYRHEFLKNSGVRFEKICGPMEDILFNLQIMNHISSFATIPGTPYHYMQHGENSLARKHYTNMFELTCRINQMRRSIFLPSGTEPEAYKDMCAFSCFRQDFHCVKNLYNGKCDSRERKSTWNYILKNPDARDAIIRSKKRYFTAKIMHIALKLRFAPLADGFIHCVMFTRKRIGPVYNKFRDRVVLKKNS